MQDEGTPPTKSTPESIERAKANIERGLDALDSGGEEGLQDFLDQLYPGTQRPPPEYPKTDVTEGLTSHSRAVASQGQQVPEATSGRRRSTVECPNCGLLNPGTALRCDCGYNFPPEPELPIAVLHPAPGGSSSLRAVPYQSLQAGDSQAQQSNSSGVPLRIIQRKRQVKMQADPEPDSRCRPPVSPWPGEMPGTQVDGREMSRIRPSAGVNLHITYHKNPSSPTSSDAILPKSPQSPATFENTAQHAASVTHAAPDALTETITTPRSFGAMRSMRWNLLWYLALVAPFLIILAILDGCQAYAQARVVARYFTWALLLSPAADIWFCSSIVSIAAPIQGLALIPGFFVPDGDQYRNRYRDTVLVVLGYVVLVILLWTIQWGCFPFDQDSDGAIRMRMIPFIPLPRSPF